MHGWAGTQGGILGARLHAAGCGVWNRPLRRPRTLSKMVDMSVG